MSTFVSYLIAGLAAGSSFALLASGFVVIFRVTGVVSLAQGTFAVLAGPTASSLLQAGLPHGAAELMAVAVAAAAGLLLAVATGGLTGSRALVLTLGAAIGTYAAEIVIWGDQPRSFAGLPGAVVLAGAHLPRQQLALIFITAVVFTLLGLFFGRTYLGAALTACASDRYAARLAGLDVARLGMLAFALAGALGGLAGVLIVPQQAVSFDSDAPLAVNGFAAAVFGGLTSIPLALAGGLALGVAEALTTGYLGGSYATEIALAVMLTVLIWRHDAAE
jgi:branched-chain amino acid transport system permease protein